MARRVFFSFHYQRDIWRVNVVRNSWVTQERTAAGFFDASLWEEAQLKSDDALKNLINGGLNNTSVTAVLIGTETASRKWVNYEIEQSYIRGNGLFGIYIHNIGDTNGRTDSRGLNPFDYRWVTNANGNRIYFSQLYRTYDWFIDNGYANLGTWVEAAAKAAGKSSSPF